MVNAALGNSKKCRVVFCCVSERIYSVGPMHRHNSGNVCIGVWGRDMGNNETPRKETGDE